MDEFLIAQHGYPPWSGEIEFSRDAVNTALDIFNIRGQDNEFAGTEVGDYTGYHVSGGIALTRRLWIDGSYWWRTLTATQEDISGTSWSLAAQYQATVNLDWLPAVSLRLSRWGTDSEDVDRSTNSVLRDFNISSVRVTSPADEQWQGDIIGSWFVDDMESFTAFFGYGKSTVSYNQLLASFSNDCVYSLQSPSKNQLTGQLYSGDPLVCELLDFNLNSNDAVYPGEGFGMAYSGTYFHFGGMYQTFDENWRFRLGYRFQSHQRSVDAEVAANDVSVVSSNHIITSEVGFKLSRYWALFARATFYKNQLLGEMPFAYNVFTAHRFDKKYGLLSFGLVTGF
ncbi:putative signal peptide protein [Magnetofaba australis IT-1]|uniref:Putative signal peptide protein n=2 Tax=Magnetofaba TaxID=1472292 RepID=A0A1Y2K4U4_9PROT|nr:putative signal peptide protein [Magnetofaba australis IT-1]